VRLQRSAGEEEELGRLAAALIGSQARDVGLGVARGSSPLIGLIVVVVVALKQWSYLCGGFFFLLGWGGGRGPCPRTCHSVDRQHGRTASGARAETRATMLGPRDNAPDLGSGHGNSGLGRLDRLESDVTFRFTVALTRWAGPDGSFRTQRAPDAQFSHFALPLLSCFLFLLRSKPGVVPCLLEQALLSQSHPVFFSSSFLFSPLGTVSAYLES
jgi:hypothetical protein